MNQAPTECESNSYKINQIPTKNHLQDTKAGLMNQAPTEYESSLYKTNQAVTE
jgi:hypothetical protein